MKRTTKSSNLKQFLDAGKAPTVVLGKVERNLLMQPKGDRREDVLHPSEISGNDWCLRASWLLLRGAQKKGDNPGLTLSSIFRTGHDTHAKWQEWIGDLGILHGVWRTDDGDVWGHGLKGRYMEVPVHDDHCRISGHADGWIVGDDEDYLLEIKTIGTGTIRHYSPSLLRESLAKSFSEIKRPFSGHVRQASLYVYLLHRMYEEGLVDRKPPEKILFLYECKENSLAKEFVVEYDMETILPILDRVALLLQFLEVEQEPTCDFPESCRKCGEVL